MTRKLNELLHRRFGFETFRPFQEAVCCAAFEGRDALLVMPTGAGKSLCYQLPGLARGGTTLVISPLVALMEDQVLKLQKLGFRAERIHAGRERAASRAVCNDYLAGKLDYLFIAPERLAVPGFPELLAKRSPSLIAVDEAHCISQWGHDFRPEYRRLGARLPSLRPAPVLALTATATPTVQDDILEQLGLQKAERFIHGFRRTNIAIEVVELPPNARAQSVANLLALDERRPAIVYAPTRKAAEALVETLRKHRPVAAYHAGLPTEKRDAVQNRFLNGELEVVVATIAFGMGIDKANVRTVIHTALPSSIEAYYQEIGRAGRDGLPSRAILMWSYADKHTHEFFRDRDYPDVAALRKIFRATTKEAQSSNDIMEETKLVGDVFEKSLEKLWIHGGVEVDPEGNVRRGHDTWEKPYTEQLKHRTEQLERVARFAQSTSCRMLQLVRHFGDQEDSGEPCGLCDICAPAESSAGHFRAPNENEEATMLGILSAIQADGGTAAGKLHRENFSKLDRRVFEDFVTALAKAKLLRVRDESFEKDGRKIAYRVLHVTALGSEVDSLADLVRIPEIQVPTASKRAKKERTALVRRAASSTVPPELSERRVRALKEWRLSEARRQKLPAFRILSDRVLNAIVEASPTNAGELLSVNGMGPKLTEKYGPEILALLET
ncbi:MAG: ATP-dependent DNA helicase RecQ [Bdellovibrionales bacterium]|nr:ATP-dependent DNA helicase RecQ [Bdellovibrionales bacterium]